ncbi:MAG: siderophore-interacting protein [Myxococcales bacterium]|nr:siderophore-interacting protein [Myxococcales bacterium]
MADRRALTPNMLRITLTGEALADFPQDSVGGYVKLVLPTGDEDVAGSEIEQLDLRSFVRRSFTVRSFDAAARALVMDVVVPGHPGPASAWAAAAQVGDAVLVHGPGPVKGLDHGADAMFLAADMAALPALAVQLERLPADARGVAVIEVLSDADRQPLQAPPGVDVHWVVSPDVRASRLAEEVRGRAWPQGRVSTWAACEFASMKQLRAYFYQERGVAREDSYLSSYWKLDASDEQHKAAKRAELEG